MIYTKRLILIAILSLIVLAGILINRPKPVKINDYYQVNQVGTIVDVPEFIPSTRTVLGMESVVENNFLELFINMNTTNFAVVDKRNNEFWTASFAVSDLVATQSFRNLQRSTFSITYKDTDNTTRTWSNFEYSIASKQYEIDFDAVENGFIINYTLSDSRPKGYWFPTKISKERYQTLVLNPFNAHQWESEADRIYFTNFIRNAYVVDPDDPDTMLLALVQSGSTAVDLVGTLIIDLYEVMYVIGHYGNAKDEEGEFTGEYTFDDVVFDNEMYEFVIEIKDPEFYIPLKVQLMEDHLHTEILTDQIVAKEPYEIASIRMLPYLGATRTFHSGYMLIPEGSGGLMHLNNGKYRQRSYTTHFYDRDLNIIPNRLTMSDVGARMPIFGTKRGDSAILGIIEEGAEHASLTTEVSLKNDSFNKSYVDFSLKAQGLYYLTQQGIPIWHPDQYQYHPTIKYYLLNDEKADYNGMAELYGKYLASKYELQPKTDLSPSLYLDVLGSYDFDDYFLFFPYKNTGALTTYDQALHMIKHFESYGIDNMVINYIGWFNKGINHESPDQLSLDEVLGSRRSFNAFNNHLQTKGYASYYDVDFIRFYDSPGLFKNRDISRVVGGTTAEFYPFDIASGLPDRTKDPYYLLKVNAIYEHMNAFLKQYNRLSAEGLSLRHFGDQIYSDFHRNNALYRYQILAYYQDMLQMASDQQPIMLSNPGVFALPFISHLANLPIETSRYLMVDESIPFYQLAIAGKVDYAMPSINLDQIHDIDYYILKAIETGSNLKFTLSYQNPNVLLSTKYNHYFSTQFSRQANQIIYAMNTIRTLPSADAYLIRHEIINPTTIRVTYSDGTIYTLDYQTLTFSH
jgi:hypothetical protein